MFALILVSLLIGQGNMLSPSQAWHAILSDDDVPRLHEIAVNSRLPRAFLALVAGCALGAAGALLQALTRNPLASPEILGVTSGAVASVLAFLAFGPVLPIRVEGVVLPFVAIGGAMVTAAVVYLLTRRFGTVESNRFIMIGILLGGILSSVSLMSLIYLGREGSEMVAWLTGSFSFKTWDDVVLAMVYIAPGVVLLVSAIPRANALQLGDDVARSLGQRRDLDRSLVLFTCVTLTAGIVATVGAIGFVGLLGPHMVRRTLGSDLRRLVPGAALAGGAMVLIADLIARNLDLRYLLGSVGERAAETFVPAGVYLTLFGVPYLAVLIWRRRG
jgi:iron complex transport system permease protein